MSRISSELWSCFSHRSVYISCNLFGAFHVQMTFDGFLRFVHGFVVIICFSIVWCDVVADAPAINKLSVLLFWSCCVIDSAILSREREATGD